MAISLRNLKSVQVSDVGGGLPSQTGNSSKYLTTDGTDPSWSFIPTYLPVLNRSGTTIQVNSALGYVRVNTHSSSSVDVQVIKE